MKKINFILASLAIVSLASCGKEHNPNGGNNKEPEVPKSTECKLSKFAVKSGDASIEGFIDQSQKTIEISYMPNEYLFLNAATAEVTISDKATIAPDPAEVIDYTVDGGVQFTVTAEDGETSQVYTVVLAEAQFTEKAELKWTKTYGELGIGGGNTGQCAVAFCGTNAFAYNTLDVFDLEGNHLGVLNTDGVPGLDAYNGQLGSMSNDEKGVLVALACYGGTNESSTVQTSVLAWIDGWDKAPTCIYGPVDYQCYFMSVSGDVKGKFVLNFRTGASAAPQMHHVLVFDGKGYSTEDNVTWYGPKIGHPGTDGCWGQQLSFFTGDPEDGFVCWDSLGNGEYDGGAGNSSSAVYVYEGLTAYNNQFAAGEVNEVALRGGVSWATWDSEPCHFGYGNFSTGHARAFVYNGQKYVLVSSSSWPCNWITIQKADNILEDDDTTDDVDESEANYFLPTQKIDGAASCYPAGAYVYDPATGVGHVLVASQSSVVVAYDMISDRI